MAFDQLLDDRLLQPGPHELGQDLSTLSLHELDERVALLEQEIERLKEARARKAASLEAASAFFRS